MAFLASISPLGGLLIGIAVLAVVTLPRGAGRWALPEPKMQPGQDPPIWRGPPDV